MAKLYEFSVNLDDRYVRVVAPDKLSASKLGAQALGVVWRERARDLVIIQGREVRRKEKEKVGLPSQSAAADSSPRGRAKGADAPGQDYIGTKGADAPGRNKGGQQKKGNPTFKTGPLAGQPMKRKGR